MFATVLQSSRRPALRVFTLGVRAALALAFVPSGFIKIVGEPFTRLPESDPVGFFFAGFFSAHGYYRFVGFAQWAAAILLLIPRFATLGAAVYLPIVLNIFAITVAIGPAFGLTRVITGAMLLANLYLIWWDWDRWRALLISPPGPGSADSLTTLGLLLAGVACLHGVTTLHLARLRHTIDMVAVAELAVGLLVGVGTLAFGYTRARRSTF